jgi:hypothetical protein
MSNFLINKYNVSIKNFKNSLKVIAVNNESSVTYTTIPIDKSNDTYGSTSCENNVSISLDMNLYDFLNNCLEGKQYYSVKITKLFDEEEDSLLVIDFIFEFEMFKFSYSLTLGVELNEPQV